MHDASTVSALSRQDLEAILAVTRALAAPHDLRTLLGEVAAAACRVLHAERCSVWLHDAVAGEVVLEVASDLAHVRVPVGVGLVGSCARERALINVPDCYADPRFDPATDRRSGFHTRCMLTLPLIDQRDELVGVMQVLNKQGSPFDAADEALAGALAAQCAVALSRARMTEALIEGEKMRQELELARVVQMSSLPAAMPDVPGYDVHGHFQPASITGGDTYDLALMGERLLVVLGDATGHGIAPALTAAQLQAMLRIAFRLGADLETAVRQINDQLVDMLPADRFITAFIGILEPQAHCVRFLSAGQGPILHFVAAARGCERHRPTGFPLGAMRLQALRTPPTIALAPGDMLVLLSDGIYEQPGPAGECFGGERVEALLREHADASAAELCERLLAAVRAFGGGAAQEDDITLVLVKRVAP